MKWINKNYRNKTLEIPIFHGSELKYYDLRNADFASCTIKYGLFVFADLRGAKFDNATLIDCSFF